MPSDSSSSDSSSSSSSEDDQIDKRNNTKSEDDSSNSDSEAGTRSASPPEKTNLTRNSSISSHIVSPRSFNDQLSTSSSDSENDNQKEKQNNKKRIVESSWEKLLRRPTTGAIDIDATKYLQRIEENPKEAKNWIFFALYLVKKDNKRAERYFKRGIAVDPTYATGYSCYGLFLETVKKEYDHAETMYKKACDLLLAKKGNDASPFCNYAVFLTKIRKDTMKAEEYYLLALRANPFHVNSRGNYGLLILHEKKDIYQAEKHLGMAARAVKDKRQSKWVKIYAQVLHRDVKDRKSAQKWMDTANKLSV